MSVLIFLIPITLLVVIIGGVAFFWAVNHDQFEDLDSPALQPLADSDSDDLVGVSDDSGRKGKR